MMKHSTSKGFTLIEVAISMALFGLIALAVASLMSTGVSTQRSYRIHEAQHNIGMNIIDNMRIDLISADDVVIAGNTLTITPSYNNGLPTPNIVWVFDNAAGQVTRDGIDMGASPYANINLPISCGIDPNLVNIGCLEGFDAAGAPTNGPGDIKHLRINELHVIHDPGATPSDNIDRAFGGLRYRINDVSYDVTGNTTFQ